MLQIGKINELEITHRVDFGLYLDGGEAGEILLPLKYASRDMKPGDKYKMKKRASAAIAIVLAISLVISLIAPFIGYGIYWGNHWIRWKNENSLVILCRLGYDKCNVFCRKTGKKNE